MFDPQQNVAACSRFHVNGPSLGQILWVSAQHCQRPGAGAELARPAQPLPTEQGPWRPAGQLQRAAGGRVPVPCPAAGPGPGGRPSAGEGTGGVCRHPRGQPGELWGTPAQPGPTEAEWQPPGLPQVLWLARCGLTDLDGIAALPALKELYASYNNISDLSPLCLLEQLELLDLEGNSVEDLGQVCFLQLCPRLATLTLEGNLVCLQPAPGPANKVPRGYNYRAEVRKLIPQLRVLDEVPAAHTGPPSHLRLSQDWLAVKEAIKKGNGLPRLGAGQVLCGNPTKGLRERRRQCQGKEPPEQLSQHRPGDLATSTSSPEPDPADSSEFPALTGLRPWRELGMRHLESQQEGAVVPGSRWWAPEEQVHQAEPKTPPSPPSLASEAPRTFRCQLVPSPPKHPMPPASGSSSPRWPTDLQSRGRRLRALGSWGPGLGDGVATMASELSPRARGCPGPKPAPDASARPPRAAELSHPTRFPHLV
uniref:leucine-rich repeat-containing protein 56 isoform X6 n=1 Tax=Callithrix jacchus TaxID=9483 RepID=UPI0023DD5E38|nr:leucine-rich repeat-containing protein 56 isoform X6 [Callithrix jacchus]